MASINYVKRCVAGLPHGSRKQCGDRLYGDSGLSSGAELATQMLFTIRVGYVFRPFKYLP